MLKLLTLLLLLQTFRITAIAPEAPTPIPTPTPIETPAPSPTPTPAQAEYREISCTITFYCPCLRCCKKNDGITASGVAAVEGVTAAMDLPFGTVLDIEGLGKRVVQDKGVTGNHVDVFVNSHSRALQLGRWRGVVMVRLLGVAA